MVIITPFSSEFPRPKSLSLLWRKASWTRQPSAARHRAGKKGVELRAKTPLFMLRENSHSTAFEYAASQTLCSSGNRTSPSKTGRFHCPSSRMRRGGKHLAQVEALVPFRTDCAGFSSLFSGKGCGFSGFIGPTAAKGLERPYSPAGTSF